MLTENLSFSVLLVLHCRELPLSEAMLLMKNVCPERRKMDGTTITIISAKNTSAQNVQCTNTMYTMNLCIVLQYKAQILSIDTIDFCFEK